MITRTDLIKKSTQIKEILDEMTRSKIIETEKISLFLDGSELITFEHLESLHKEKGNVVFEIQEGVLLRFNHAFDENLHMTCSMTTGYIYDPHYHDFYEYFFITKGKLKDRQSGQLMERGIIYTFNPHQIHNLEAIEDSVMMIIGSNEPIVPHFES